MTREDIISKIKKLLALSDKNPNQNEAIAAALKAQKLMAEYDVQETELAEELAEKEVVEIYSDPYSAKRWRDCLASAIATNFRCKAYMDEHKDESTNWVLQKQMVFVGYDLDAKAAKLTFEKLAEVAEKLVTEEVHRAKQEYGTSQGVRNTFLLGFVQGVRQELEKQSQALMLVCPKEVEDKFNALSIKKAGGWTIRYAIDATEEGRSAGRDAVRSGRMDAAEERLLA